MRSCTIGCVARNLRAALRTKWFTTPNSAQTCANCAMVTIVARGSGSGGAVCVGHGACISCVCGHRESEVLVSAATSAVTYLLWVDEGSQHTHYAHGGFVERENRIVDVGYSGDGGCHGRWHARCDLRIR
jgi:hypothetical protein